MQRKLILFIIQKLVNGLVPEEILSALKTEEQPLGGLEHIAVYEALIQMFPQK